MWKKKYWLFLGLEATNVSTGTYTISFPASLVFRLILEHHWLLWIPKLPNCRPWEFLASIYVSQVLIIHLYTYISY